MFWMLGAVDLCLEVLERRDLLGAVKVCVPILFRLGEEVPVRY